MSRQSYAELESAEARGAISIRSLQRAAEAMDCELAYFVLPRESKVATRSKLVRPHDPTEPHVTAAEHSVALESEAAGELRALPTWLK